MFRNGLIPAPPMRKRLGVLAATAFAERSMESTSAAARIISLTRATESVESPASSWAATPETCGAAMLVPLIELVAVLLEPTHAARMSEPGACAHTRGGGHAAAGGYRTGEGWMCVLACGRKAGERARAGGRGRARAGMQTWVGAGEYRRV